MEPTFGFFLTREAAKKFFLNGLAIKTGGGAKGPAINTLTFLTLFFAKKVPTTIKLKGEGGLWP